MGMAPDATNGQVFELLAAFLGSEGALALLQGSPQYGGPLGNELLGYEGPDASGIVGLLKLLQGDSGSGAGYAQVDLGYAQLAQRQAEAQADELYKSALLSLQSGDQALATKQFAASEEQRAIANDMQNKVFEYQKSADATGNALSAYGQMENSAIGRGNLAARGAEGMGTLANNYGNLLAEQQRLALEQLKTPRNAIASFLIGQGMGVDDATSAQGKFNPKNLFGLDPNALSGMFQQAFGAAQGINNGQSVAPQTTAPDIAGFLKALQGFAGTQNAPTNSPIADGMNNPTQLPAGWSQDPTTGRYTAGNPFANKTAAPAPAAAPAPVAPTYTPAPAPAQKFTKTGSVKR